MQFYFIFAIDIRLGYYTMHPNIFVSNFYDIVFLEANTKKHNSKGLQYMTEDILIETKLPIMQKKTT